MAKVKLLLFIKGWWMEESQTILAPLLSTGGDGPSSIILAAKYADMWAKQQAQLL